MIEASFDSRNHKLAAIGGVYQYDTGQRLRMHGLPTPEELLEMDELLSGETATVQVQYSHKGDEQSEMRLAHYDEKAGCWLADVPGAYLTRSAPVLVYVYVMYGTEGGISRAKTCYEAAFTPVSRPAPGTMVTPDQGNEWDALVGEINLTLSTMNTAVSGANAAAEEANDAIREARAATEKTDGAVQSAQEAAQRLRDMHVTAETLDPGSGATAAMRRARTTEPPPAAGAAVPAMWPWRRSPLGPRPTGTRRRGEAERPRTAGAPCR